MVGVGYTLSSNGEFFQGYFKQNYSEWLGRIFLANGDYYEGNYKNDKRHGKALYEFDLTNTKMIWEYLNGERSGPVVLYKSKSEVNQIIRWDNQNIKI